MTDSTEWRPSPGEVATLIARLVPDATGQILGQFSGTTIPTSTQVTQVISGIAAEVGHLTSSLPAAVYDLARRVTALGAAVQVAIAFFPEVTAAYLAQLRAEYETAKGLLVASANRLLSDDAGGQAVNRLPIHNLRPLPPYVNQYQQPYTDPYWPY